MGVSLATLVSAGSVNVQVSRKPFESMRSTVVGVNKATSSIPVWRDIERDELDPEDFQFQISKKLPIPPGASLTKHATRWFWILKR